MGVIFLLLGVWILWFVHPYERCLRKRIVCYEKLKRLCKSKGFSMQGNHLFWLLGSRNGKRFDLYIETPTNILGVKLFGVVHHLRTLVFVEDGTYFLRRHMGVMLWIKDETLDGKSRKLLQYDFLCKNREMSPEKKKQGILLVNPVPVEMLQLFENGKEEILNPGDKVRDYEVFNLSGLLMKLEGLE